MSGQSRNRPKQHSGAELGMRRMIKGRRFKLDSSSSWPNLLVSHEFILASLLRQDILFTHNIIE